MSDQFIVPALPDGMGVFTGPQGEIILMRNHEVDLGDWRSGPYGRGPVRNRPHRYSKNGFGGVTRVVVDGKTFKKMSSNLVLEGTARNCAGGVSPWGWLSCEECVMPQEHGYVFLCDPLTSSAKAPLRLDGYGRFNHEAAVVDPQTHVAYLTEDREDGCFYRFRPFQFDRPFEGELEALVVEGTAVAATTSHFYQVGQEELVSWVKLSDPTPKRDSLRHQAQDKGAALFARGEGLFYQEGQIYFTCTSGGPVQGGQIFRYTPHDPERGKLTLVGMSENRSRLDMPDNLTLSPWGSVFLAEDGGSPCHIRVLTKEGRLVDFARNARSSSELSGVCFAPNGQALFLNLQSDGLTVCITGPFAEWHSTLGA